MKPVQRKERQTLERLEPSWQCLCSWTKPCLKLVYPLDFSVMWINKYPSLLKQKQKKKLTLKTVVSEYKSVALPWTFSLDWSMSLAWKFWKRGRWCSGKLRLVGDPTWDMSVPQEFVFRRWLNILPSPFRSHTMEYRPCPAVAGVGSQRIWASRRWHLIIPEYRREGAVQDDQRWLPEAHPELQRWHPSVAPALPQRE